MRLSLLVRRSLSARAHFRAGLGAALIVAGAVLVAGVLILLALDRGFQPEVVLYNPAFQYDFWPFSGLVLHIGVFAIGSAGVICLFAARHAAGERGLLLCAGLFSLILAADDFFMLHQHFWARRGVPKEAVYAAYGALCLAGAVRFRATLIGWRHVAAWVATALLAGSLAVDLAADPSRRVLVLEDTLKFTGFVLWAYYWITRAHRAVGADAPAVARSAEAAARERPPAHPAE